MFPVLFVRTLTVLVGALAANIVARLTTPLASVAMLCWSGVVLDVDSTMPLVVAYVPSVMSARNDLTVMVSVTGFPATVVVRVAVTATHPQSATANRPAMRAFILAQMGWKDLATHSGGGCHRRQACRESVAQRRQIRLNLSRGVRANQIVHTLIN